MARSETDSIGAIDVPDDAYWGAQTQRSIENFPFGETERMPLGIVHALALIKQAAARINQPRPIMHGLCTLAASTLELARVAGVHPADLVSLEGRFAAAIHPGEAPSIVAWGTPDDLAFQVTKGDQVAISGARVSFSAR